MTTPAASTTTKPATAGDQIIPVSAEVKPPLTEEQRKRRYQELRQRMGHSRLKVEGESGKHYLWAARSDSNEFDRLDLLGYSIVREPNAKDVLAGKVKPKIRAGGLKEDGTYIQGDVILMQCDEDVYEFLMLENENKSNLQQQSAKDNFRFESEKTGVPTFDVDKSKVGR